MIQVITEDFLVFVFAVLLAFLVDNRKAAKYWYLLLIFLLIGFVDNLFLTITWYYPELQIINTSIWGNQLFSWSGKLYSIVFALIMQISLKKNISLKDTGLTIKQNSNSIKFSLIAVLLFFIIASSIGILSKKGDFNTEVLLFLAIMPGLGEELIYRGLLLGLLNKIFERKFKFLGTNFGWGLILTSIVFGLLHGFNLNEDFRFQFDFITILMTGTYGFIYGMIRERSGSLVFPVIAHSATDFFNFFFRMI